MRGKGCPRLDTCDTDRITPAYAGKSIASFWYTFPVQDHPRLCGEKYSNIETSVSNMGSPPPMRGKGTFIEYGNVKFRITPAYAGKSCLAILPVCF